MQDQTKDVIRYSWFWLWLLTVSVGVWYAYDSVLQTLPDLLASVLRIDHFVSDVDVDAPVWWLLQILLLILLWWRVIKVVVLHGSPVNIGLTISEGREDDSGQSGRMVHRVWIGDLNVHETEYKGQFWYGAVFRSHPSSDKLVRSRLELLLLALPFGCTLHVQESRVFIHKDGHQARARKYRLVWD